MSETEGRGDMKSAREQHFSLVVGERERQGETE